MFRGTLRSLKLMLLRSASPRPPGEAVRLPTYAARPRPILQECGFHLLLAFVRSVEQEASLHLMDQNCSPVCFCGKFGATESWSEGGQRPISLLAAEDQTFIPPFISHFDDRTKRWETCVHRTKCLDTVSSIRAAAFDQETDRLRSTAGNASSVMNVKVFSPGHGGIHPSSGLFTS